MTIDQIWNAVLGELELSISKANFTTWFRNTAIGSYQNGEVTIYVPNTFTKAWFEKKFHSNILHTLENVTNEPVKRILYKVENVRNVVLRIEPVQDTEFTPSNIQEVSTVYPSSQQSFGLNPKYHFGAFIVGKGNELAHAACQAAANNPGVSYNPLFIYGGVGLGKTHLLQAVGHAILGKDTNKKVLYVTCEAFTNDFIRSVRTGKAKEFKDRYRTVDALLIDDIQFITGKEGTQEEFFHTFNALHQFNKQVVLTSDRPPKAIPALESRLQSRFEWGLTVDVSSPDYETRVAILRAKCQEKNCSFFSNEMLQQIATLVQSNIRELEGALNKIIAYHELKNTRPTVDTIRSLLSSVESVSFRKSVTPKQVILTVSKFYDLAIEEILGKSREKRLALPRQIIMFIMREELKSSYPAIGQEIGGRDHTTAMHAYSKILAEIENDLKLKQDLEMIRQRLYVQSV